MSLISRYFSRLVLILFAFTFFPLIADTTTEQTFFEQELEIRKDLYKISAPDLQNFFGIKLAEVPTTSAEDLKLKMEIDPDLCVINVLPPILHNDCHITDSINIPLKELVDTMASWDRDKEIIVYCALYECDAGEKAYILLSCLGFTNVTDYSGGIKEWFQMDYPTQGPATYSFLHTKAGMFPNDILVCSRQQDW